MAPATKEIRDESSPVFPAEDKIRIVLSVLADEVPGADAARRNKVSETSIGKWKQQFLEAGKAGLTAGGSSRPSGREQTLPAPAPPFRCPC